jgi:hypothetical protein
MKISKTNMIICSIIVAVAGIIIFALFSNPTKEQGIDIGRAVDDLNPPNISIQEPLVTIAATEDNLRPDVKLFTPANPQGKITSFHVLVENYSISDAEGNVDRTHTPPIPLVRKGVPTNVDAVIVPTLPGEDGTFYVALEFSYCPPLYQHNGQDGPCFEKNLSVSLPQHVVSLNQHFNLTVTAPENTPSGLYQLGINVRTNLYTNTNHQMSGTSYSEPFWIRVVN